MSFSPPQGVNGIVPPGILRRHIIRHPLALWISRLDAHVVLDAADRSSILKLPVSVRTYDGSSDIFSQGVRPEMVAFLTRGYTVGQLMGDDGKGQILSLGIPGDALGLEHLYLREADYDTRVLGTAEVALVSRRDLADLASQRPAIAQAFAVSQAIDAAITREWLRNVGSRDGLRRIAHFLCEFACRIDARGLKTDDCYELPLSQQQIGRATGMTAVHVNRMLKTLHTAGLIERSWRNVRFPRWDRLREIAGFSDAYLHAGAPLAEAPARA